MYNMITDVGKFKAINSNHKVQSSNLNVQRTLFMPLVESYAHAR